MRLRQNLLRACKDEQQKIAEKVKNEIILLFPKEYLGQKEIIQALRAEKRRIVKERKEALKVHKKKDKSCIIS